MRFPLPLVAILASFSCLADEGLWLFNNFPAEQVEKKYGFKVTDGFLDHLRLSSVRLGSGGSGSFVSPKGLVLTNHHVAFDCIQKLSSKEHDYVKNGFSAARPSDELACPDLEINVLLKMEEMTERVTGGIPPDTAPAEANRKRRASIAAIEKECSAATGNRCDVVTLFSGGRYDLYQYGKYTDVRLVFAPEFGIAFFGGDDDNFEYPRYALDMAFLRVYENGKPLETPNHLRFSKTGAKEGELTFVSGHPGTTQRLATVANLEFVRDIQAPLALRRLSQFMAALTKYGSQGTEQMRQRNDLFFGASNSFKAYTGFLGGLRDPALMTQKREEEGKLRDAVASKPALQTEYGSVWKDVAEAFAGAGAYYPKYYAYETVALGGSSLGYYARTLTRMAEEDKKPNGQRLKEYNDAARPELEQELFSTAPVYPEMEVAILAENLRFMSEELGADDPVVKELLQGKTPLEVARAAVESTKLADVEWRRKLAKDPSLLDGIKDDGVFRIARIVDDPARKYRKRWEDEIQAVLAISAGKIARARFDAFSGEEYPDATFTLRLTYGPAKGYTDAKGRKIPWATEMRGAFGHETGKYPYVLPASWKAAKGKLKANVPFNFVTTNDIHGGNSGSPTVDTKGELVGLIFDGNIESLPNRYVYEDGRARATHVASQGILHALREVYGAKRVLSELGF